VLTGQAVAVSELWVTITVTDATNAKDARTFHLDIKAP